MKKNKSLRICLFIGCLALVWAFGGGPALGEMKTYNVTASWDFSGPYADVMKSMSGGQKLAFAWWNEEVGKQLGVQLNLKGYDLRYDATLVASKWPGILSSDQPIGYLGLGGPDVAALMKRMSTDKVPMFMSTATYGYIWGPGYWVFQLRPTYPHEAIGLYAHLSKLLKRKIKIACINAQGIPAYEEFVTGAKKYAEEVPDAVIEVVGVEWVPVRPVDITSQVARLLKKGPDFFDVFTNVPQVVATRRALQTLKQNIPIRMSSHNGLEMSAKALGSLKDFEGCYDSYSFRPAVDHSPPAYQVFMKYKDQIDKELEYDVVYVQMMMQATMLARAVERVAKAKGPDKITGEALYNGMFDVNIPSAELLGLVNDQYFTRDQPFTAKNLACMATMVKDGKQVLVTPDWMPIPEIPKW